MGAIVVFSAVVGALSVRAADDQPADPSAPDRVAIRESASIAGNSRRDVGNGASEIQRLVKQLGDGDYRRREDATTQLMTAGPDAIDPVTKAALVKDVETAYRAVRILQAFSDRDDNKIQQRAVTALESLAADENETTADLATDALAFYHLTLQDRAIDQLKQLGAAVRQVRDGDQLFLALGSGSDGSRGGARYPMERQVDGF